MEFAFLPPEVNSGRMYSGPGSGPLLAAAGSWDALAAELDVTAQTYASVLAGLTNRWHGPASAAMTLTALPYIDWLQTTAEQTRQTAMQARAAAAAYELAYALTVPPTVVAANRIALASLIATNFFGQNTPAIAANEAQYAEFWAQDTAAMSSYAANSAAATQLAPFASPNRSANASATNAASNTATAAPAQAISRGGDLSLRALYTALDPSSLFYLDIGVFDEIRLVGTSINSSFKIEAITSGVIGADSNLGILPNLGAQTVAAVDPAPQLAKSTTPAPAGAGLRTVSATLARSGRIGSMSVPVSWATPANGAASAVAASEGTAIVEAAAPAGSGLGAGPGVPGMTVSRPSYVVPRYGRRILAVMGRPPAAG